MRKIELDSASCSPQNIIDAIDFHCNRVIEENSSEVRRRWKEKVDNAMNNEVSSKYTRTLIWGLQEAELSSIFRITTHSSIWRLRLLKLRRWLTLYEELHWQSGWLQAGKRTKIDLLCAWFRAIYKWKQMKSGNFYKIAENIPHIIYITSSLLVITQLVWIFSKTTIFIIDRLWCCRAGIWSSILCEATTVGYYLLMISKEFVDHSRKSSNFRWIIVEKIAILGELR